MGIAQPTPTPTLGTRLVALESDAKDIQCPATDVCIPRNRLAMRILSRRRSGIRASLIRANACHFADRYTVADGGHVDEGSFGRVHRCTDNLAQTGRAVKAITIPTDDHQLFALRGEVEALVALDHPHIVRLIEYFVESKELLLVMELLEGPTLGRKMQEDGRFSEQFSARCVRHMLKALFCCHCQGIVHNDVSTDNFKFQTPLPDSCLKMVDFGLSERFTQDRRFAQDLYAAMDDRDFTEKRDIWRAGIILYGMLDGSDLFPQASASAGSGSGGGRIVERLVCATDPTFVPRKLRALQVSGQARGLLEGMLRPSTASRLAAPEALIHPFITRFYSDAENAKKQGKNVQKSLIRCTEALRALSQAVRLKRLGLLIVAHLLTNNNPAIAGINFLFRFLVRDGHMVELDTMRRMMHEHQVDVPDDFSTIFQNADIAGRGGLHYVEFVATSIITEPSVFCNDTMLRSVFRFLESDGTGELGDDNVLSAFPRLPMCGGGGMVREACGRDTMFYSDFEAVMVPKGWEEQAKRQLPAPWADAPDGPYNQCSAGAQAAEKRDSPGRYNPVTSAKSESFNICQSAGFHSHALRPLYAAQPISNVVLGIVHGTSGYARRAVELGLVDIVEVGERNGAFFFMPNPKYHWTPDDVSVGGEDARFRYVAWWVHPTLLGDLKAWVATCRSRTSSSGTEPPSPSGASRAHEDPPPAPNFLNRADEPGELASLGAPGDFGFSDVQKPEDYLHTYRDFSGPAHLEMLEALVAGMGLFLERLMGAALPAARLSAGFHYPVRPQYSTLHLQLRVNSGDVCGGQERRGMDLFKLLARIRADPAAYSRDDEILHYQATANLRTTVLAAADSAERCVKEVGPQSLLLN